MPIGTVGSNDLNADNGAWVGSAERDLLALGTVVAAIILFIGTGGTVLSGVFAQYTGTGMGPDRLLACAFILNIALIIFGWRRYRDLNNEMQVRRIAEEQARILAKTDPLTGCLNRRSIGDVTDRFLAEIAQRGKAAAFVMLDLDNFKQVNDVNGHAAGDALLCAAASRIKQLLPSESLLARFGGDEFACIIPFDPSQHELIDRLCEELIAAVGRPVVFRGAELETTVSAGVTRSDGLEVVHDAQTLLHMADIAMYHAKKRGRNRHYWFEPSMESELRFRSELEAGIRRGITLDEFVPYYEKQIDLKTGELVGFEMLARWQSPTLGIVGPDIFIPIAEEIGVIAQLSENLIRKALKDARSWDPKLTLSVNISPIQLRDPWFAQKLLKLLVEANFPANRLDIEVTENSLHDNVAMVRSMITSLKNQGISVSLDDFGTGYSSLSQLQSLPFDRIKIDRSFITTLPGSRDSATIVRSITSLGQGLGLPITAEGVENEEILRELRQFGDFKAQGYLYGRPSPASATHAELAQLNLLLEPAEVEAEDAAAADQVAAAAGIARIA